MVWFQCEVCGDNLKKPKLPGHFRVCSAHKLSCIDCGETFSQQSVQGHTQCITETEKYGPKGQNKVANGATPKAKSDSKQKPEVDIFVGLSERPPWFCSLCNTSATSKQTLLLHAEGKKHRAKARAYHASKQPPKENEEALGNDEKTELPPNENPSKETTEVNINIEEETVNTKKRKLDVAKEIAVFGESGNGEVIQVENVGKEENNVKKSKKSVVKENEGANPESNEEGKKKKIKWKKLITLALKSEPDSGLKMRKLRKSVFKTIKALGFTEDESQLTEMLEQTVNSSSKFTVEGKYVRLVAKS